MKLVPLLLLGAVLVAGCGAKSSAVEVAELVPNPETVSEDKGPAILDGCRSGTVHTEAWACVWGNPGSDRTVVLWGDSHAMQYAPPLIEMARQRGWRLVGMFRGNCLTADVEYRPECVAWRESAMARIEEEQPDLVLTSTDTGNGYALWRDDERMTRKASETRLRRAYARTLRKLRGFTVDGTGQVLVFRDLPRSAGKPSDCLVENQNNPRACDFKGYRKHPPGFETVAAKQVDGASLIDLSDLVCPAGTCSAARDGLVVYRDATHISATYALSLTSEIAQRVDAAVDWSP